MNGFTGHMPFLTENLDFSFEEICFILKGIEGGSIPVTEKFDGLNLCISLNFDKLNNPRLIAMRNIKEAKAGLNFLEFKEKWAGHPAELSFVKGFKFLSSIFENDRFSHILENRFLNLEIIFPNQPNIIKYDQCAVVLHSLFEITSGNALISDQFGFESLIELVDGTKEKIDEQEWVCLSPNSFKLNSKEFSPVAIDKIKKLYPDLKMTLKEFVTENLRNDLSDLGLNSIRVNQCVNAALGISQSSITQILKGLPPLTKKKASQIASKAGFKLYCQKLLEPLDIIINDYYKKIMVNVDSPLIQNKKYELKRIKSLFDDSYQHLLNTSLKGNTEIWDYIKKNKEKINLAKKISTPIEGIVFEWPEESGQKFKITADFSIVNQVINRSQKIRGKFTHRQSKKLAEAVTHSEIKIGIVPISAKPYHLGHDYLVQMASKENDFVKLFVSLKDRKRTGEYPIFGNTMKMIWEEEIISNLPSNVEVIFVTSPIQATMEEVGNYSSDKEFANFSIYSDNLDTHSNFPLASREKYMSNQNATTVFPAELSFDKFSRKSGAPNVSGTSVRAALDANDFSSFSKMMPVWMNKEKVWKALRLSAQPPGRLWF
jgi:hypothetical protein